MNLEYEASNGYVFTPSTDTFDTTILLPAVTVEKVQSDDLVYPASFPKTRLLLESKGIKVRVVDVSELQKAEGALTCCSLIFDKDGEANA